MNSLPGNPYIGEPDGDGVIDAVVLSADNSPMQTTELLLDHLKNATLALAFEQRTANLIAWTSTPGTRPTEWMEKAIAERLGFDGDDS